MNTEQTPGRIQNTPPGDRESSEHHHSWMPWIILLAVLVLGFFVFRFVFTPKKPKTPVAPPVSITVTNVQTGDIDVAVSSLGSVTPIYTATISPRVDGQVLAVNYSEGQMVSSNDLLALIDPGPYQSQVTAASGQLARDKAVLEGAKVDLERYKAAATKKAIPQQQVDDQLALVHQDEGVIRLDEGNLENAQVNLAYCYIRAPFSGRVGLRLIDPGNIVHAANTNAMVVVAQLQPITVIFNVAEDYLPQIQAQLKTGKQMAVEAWDRSNEHKLSSGTVLALNNMIDTATGTIRIKALFTNEDMALFPNQFVNARLIIQVLTHRSLVPTYAIQHNPEGAFLYVVTNGVETLTNGATTNVFGVTMRNITPGVTDGNTTAITDGVQPGDIIALDNFNKLGEGTKVIPRHGDGAGQAGGAGGKRGGGQHKKKTDDSKDGS